MGPTENDSVVFDNQVRISVNDLPPRPQRASLEKLEQVFGGGFGGFGSFFGKSGSQGKKSAWQKGLVRDDPRPGGGIGSYFGSFGSSTAALGRLNQWGGAI